MKNSVLTANPLAIADVNSGKTTETVTSNYGDKLKSALIVDADDAPTDRLPIAISELLDRFVIMYPTVLELEYLRKAVVDKDLDSIFRLCEHSVDFKNAVLNDDLRSIFKLMEIYPIAGHCEDLRKAMVDRNLDSMFRLFPITDSTVNLYKTAIVSKNIGSIFKILGSESDDLRKVILESNNWKIWPLLSRYTTTHFISAFKSLYINNITIDVDAFSRSKVRNNVWLVDKLSRASHDLGLVYLCAGQYATLATMLFESGIKLNSIRSFDPDEQCRLIAETFNKPWVKDNWKFKASTKDISTIDFNMNKYEVFRSDGTISSLLDSPDTIINNNFELSETLTSWYNKITNGKLVVMQTKCFERDPEHIHIDLAYFDSALPMQQTLYLGELMSDKYTSYMKIGIK